MAELYPAAPADSPRNMNRPKPTNLSSPVPHFETAASDAVARYPRWKVNARVTNVPSVVAPKRITPRVHPPGQEKTVRIECGSNLDGDMSASVFKPIRQHDMARIRTPPPLERRFGVPKDVQKVRRVLFGPVDHEENRRMAEEHFAKQLAAGMSRWEFDFKKGVSTVFGCFVWVFY